MAYIRPQAINLRIRHLILINQHRFHRFGVLSGFSQPIQNGIVFETFHPADNAEPHPFRQYCH
jgi:hypothetical protein